MKIQLTEKDVLSILESLTQEQISKLISKQPKKWTASRVLSGLGVSASYELVSKEGKE